MNAFNIGQKSEGLLPGRTAKAPRRRGRKSPLSQLLIDRLAEPALTIPYAAGYARAFRARPERTTLGEVIVDIVCLNAVRHNATFMRCLWERSDGKPAMPRAGDRPPRCVRAPLPAPALPEGPP